MLTPLPSLSLVICTLNRAYFLRFVLQTVMQCRHAFQELIVVMGPCDDDTAHVLKTYHARIDQLLTTRYKNISVARNIGVRAASQDLVLFLDDDVMPSIAWIMTHRQMHQQLGESYAVVAGQVADCSQPSEPIAQFTWGVQDRWSRSHPVLSPSQQQTYLQRPGWFPGVMGANASYRRSAVLMVGGFDEFYEYFLEETDLCLRLLNAGYRIHHCDCVVEHYVQPSHNRRARTHLTCWYSLAKNTTYFALKHRPSKVSARLFWGRLVKLLYCRCIHEILCRSYKGQFSLWLGICYIRDVWVGFVVGRLAAIRR
jgi:GT2 family glycosyltransferase